MEQQKPTHHGVETELSRDLGLTTALAIGVGTMIAAGIFTLPVIANMIFLLTCPVTYWLWE